jgi:hypothetical protein
MKRIKFLAIATALIISANVSAESFRERADNWRQENRSSNDDIQRIGTPTPDPTVPIGDGLIVLMCLAGGYAIMRRKEKATNN